ncbi:MAG: lytic murein transglycosylase [Thermodesulfobacteriota bacterium]
MKKSRLLPKTGYWILLLWLSFSSMAYGGNTGEVSSLSQSLIQRLSQDGFDSEFLSKLLTDPRAGFIAELTMISLISRETPEAYAQFLRPESILLAKKFLQENLKILREAEQQFNVDKEVIVGILLVESRFGENIGRYRVISTLASMALMDSPEVLQKVYLSFQEINPDLSSEWIEGLAKRKSEWAYQELKSFLRIVQNEKMDPLEVFGSYAGAMGMPQFIPSSYITYAVRKESLEKWLLSKEEAILSIGNYLKSHGWKKSLSTSQKKQILFRYNQSDPYGETILQVAQKIKPQLPNSKPQINSDKPLPNSKNVK